MKLPAIMAGFTLAIVAMLAGGTPVSAQTTTKHTALPPKVVTIQTGDTLVKIADTNHTTYPRIYDANGYIKDPNLIYPGKKVRIPTASEKLPNRPLPSDAPAQPAPAPAAQSAPAAAAPVQTAPVAQAAPVSGCGDNFYANFIYSHESGCRTTAMSPNGCYGIGQACPASKIYYCGADYACQNAYFTAYAGKYGGWAGAYAFWVAHGWW